MLFSTVKLSPTMVREKGKRWVGRDEEGGRSGRDVWPEGDRSRGQPRGSCSAPRLSRLQHSPGAHTCSFGKFPI